MFYVSSSDTDKSQGREVGREGSVVGERLNERTFWQECEKGEGLAMLVSGVRTFRQKGQQVQRTSTGNEGLVCLRKRMSEERDRKWFENLE